jgi:MarR family transcriptional regulator, organic hydroperoxide resistance regulator
VRQFVSKSFAHEIIFTVFTEKVGPVAQLEPSLKDDVQQILETIIYLYTESRRITKELARRAQLTGPQLTVVKILEQIGDLSLSELSERIRAQNSTVTGIIDRMEREGLVVRERSTEDRRVVIIKLTAKGTALAEDIPIEPMKVFQSALASLTKDEMRELLRILLKVSKRVKAIVRRDVGEAAPEKSKEIAKALEGE